MRLSFKVKKRYMNIKETKRYIKSYNKIDKVIKIKVFKALEIFINNPFDKKLNNHELKWKLIWIRSINITWDYRLLFRELSNWNYELVELLDINNHSNLYK